MNALLIKQQEYKERSVLQSAENKDWSAIAFFAMNCYTPPAPQARGGLKEIIQFFSYRLAKPLKPIFFPKVEKSEAN